MADIDINSAVQLYSTTGKSVVGTVKLAGKGIKFIVSGLSQLSTYIKTHGQQDLKTLTKSGAQLTSVEIADKDIDQIRTELKQNGVDFSLHKSSEKSNETTLFVKAASLDVLNLALKKVIANNVDKTHQETEQSPTTEQAEQSPTTEKASATPVEIPMAGEIVNTHHGTYQLTNLTKEQMQAAGYESHHNSIDGKYEIMTNGDKFYAVARSDPSTFNRFWNRLKGGEEQAKTREAMRQGKNEQQHDHDRQRTDPAR